MSGPSYEPVMRPGLATPDEKKAAQGYTDPDSGVLEVERPWYLQPVYEPDPRTVFRGLKVDGIRTTPSGTLQRNARSRWCSRTQAQAEEL
jgi:hypothetical protein